jgi:hypothetical protein
MFRSAENPKSHKYDVENWIKFEMMWVLVWDILS